MSNVVGYKGDVALLVEGNNLQDMNRRVPSALNLNSFLNLFGL